MNQSEQLIAGPAIITPPIRVLIAEDEANLGTILEQFMLARGFSVTVVRNGRAAFEQLQLDRYDVALLDIVMPEMDGLEVLQRVRALELPPEVVVITGNGTLETALAAMKLGAYDFVSKPYRMAEIEALVRRAWEKRVLLRKQHGLESRLERAEPSAVIDTEFAPLRAVLALLQRVAPTEAPILITGEAGTGKTGFARYIHDRSGAADPFVKVDAANLKSATSTSDISRNLADAIDLAAAGTVYLHNVEQLSQEAQKTFVLAFTQRFVNVADHVRRVPVQARLVASSVLNEEALAKHLDADFLRIVSQVRVMLPALRDRLVDLPLLAGKLLSRAGGTKLMTPAALARLQQYTWPGNVRELELVLERAALLAGSGDIDAQHLVLGTAKSGDAAESAGSALDLHGLERRHIAYVLERTGWHQGKAAILLGISPKTLYRKIREYGFRRPGPRRD